MKRPLVSIIIPTYNRGNLISDTLDSICIQTYQNWECIIVDDGSIDNTKQIVYQYLKKDSRFQYHLRPEYLPKGGNAARNYGFEISKGKYVNWFDDDDIMLENFIFDKVNQFSFDQIQLVICSMFYVNEKLQETEKVDLQLNSFLFKEYVTWDLKIITNSILFKKKFLQGKDLFNLKILRGQETEFFSRLFFCLPENNYRIINTPLFLYRQHRETKTAKNKLYNNDYKESQAYISLENLKRSLIINNNDLINYYYKILIDLFFSSLKNNHLSNSRFIVSNFSSILIKMRKRVGFEFYIFGNILILIKKGSYRLEKYFKSYQF